MPLIIPHSLKPGMTPHEFFVTARARDVFRSRIASPQTEAEREAFVEGPAKEAFDAAIKEGLPEAYAKSAAQKARLEARDILSQLMQQDRRSTAALDFWVRKEDALLPEAKPEITLYVSFDYDMDAPINAVKQAYEAAKTARDNEGALRFPGARYEPW